MMGKLYRYFHAYQMRLLSHANADKKKWHCYIPEVLTENELNIKGLIVYLQKLKKL